MGAGFPGSITEIGGLPSALIDPSGLTFLARGSGSTPGGGGGDAPSYDYTNTQSLSFDGVDDYVELSTYTSDVYALSMWFKPDTAITTSSTAETLFATSSLQIMFTGSVTGSVLNELLLFSNGYFRSAYTQASGTIPSAWHHFVMNWNGSEYELWLNGTNVQNAETGTQALVTASTIRLGLRTTGASPFHGLISQFATWNDAGLTSGEIASLYNAGVPVAPDSVKSTEVQWLIEEGTDSTVADSTGSNDGTISGATWSTDVPDGSSQVSTSFDGVDDEFQAAIGTSLLASDFSFSFWLKSPNTSAGEGALLNQSYGATGRYGWRLYKDSSGDLSLWVGDGSGGYDNPIATVTPGFGNDIWTHVLFSRESGTFKLYVNGSSVSLSQGATNDFNSGSVSFSDSSPSLEIIETSIGNGPCQALVDEVAVWSSAQSSNVSTIYNSGVPNNISSLSPVHWWRMGEEKSGTTIYDQGSGSVNGTLVGGASISTDVRKWNHFSLDFDGVDDRMEIVGSQSAGTYDFLHNSKTFTVMGWFKLDDYTLSDSITLVQTNYTGSLIGFNFWMDLRDNGGAGTDHALRCNIDDGTNSTSVYQEAVISDNDWHHYAVTGDGTTLKLYIDGSVQSSTASLPAATSSSAAYNLRVGHRAGIAGAPFPGLIDEVAIFSSALSAAQISAIYNIGLPDDLTSYSPFNWWRMGDQINGTTIPDQGSGSDDGTLSGPVISTNVPS